MTVRRYRPQIDINGLIIQTLSPLLFFPGGSRPWNFQNQPESFDLNSAYFASSPGRLLRR